MSCQGYLWCDQELSADNVRCWLRVTEGSYNGGGTRSIGVILRAGKVSAETMGAKDEYVWPHAEA